jgi:hypothetical protein
MAAMFQVLTPALTVQNVEAETKSGGGKRRRRRRGRRGGRDSRT